MGDRTQVWITVHKDVYNKLTRVHFKSEDEFLQTMYISNVSEDKNHNIALYAEEINHANWDELEGILQLNKYEYDKEWGDGAEYTAGHEYYRMINNKYKSFEIYAVSEEILTLLKNLLKNKDLKQAIKKEIKIREPFKPKPLQPLKCNAELFIEDINKKK